ncbi:allantoate amidohydrolase [Acidomonas methanolica]|uniref:allantoate amidohydrolase n=1 Tax=Acidomonas methanolica TaxID=437 RepID=UPI002119FDF3|nr:allantoate amidohydrolase [Acidomonas methanolica]MCQ9155823.1 allantoate amidohydrolase [Acidomonas methanolica]
MRASPPMPPARAKTRCDVLGVGPFSDRAGSLFRPWLGPAHRATLEQVAVWMREAGMTVAVDQAANIVGHYPGLTRDAPVLLLGSHLDSVENAGRYDGVLGVMLGIEAVAHFHAAGRRFPFAIDVIGFGDEEGSRFPTYMIGSRSVAGCLPHVDPSLRDAAGVTLAEALAEWGQTIETLPLARRERIAAYVEAHIEQAPHLERAGQALGVVRGIASQLRYRVRVTGEAAHAGTAMGERQDALAAAAEGILAIERIGASGPPDLVATVGVLTVAGGAPNIVAGDAVFSLDIRALDPTIRDGAAREIAEALDGVAARRGVTVTFEREQDLSGARCDAALAAALAEAAERVTGQVPPSLVSQAGHDAMVMAHAAPMVMLFIRCAGGISHNPAESVAPEDVDAARDTLIGFIERFGVSA